MNLNQLTVFHEVMTTGSISQAARNLGRTQPAISLALKALEDTLGFQLFQRQGRALLPVPEAQYLLEEASEILDRVAQVNRTLDNLKSRRSGRLTIAAMPGPSALLFPRFISAQIGARTDVLLNFITRSSPQILQLVSSQYLDFGFADSSEAERADGPYRADVISARCECALPASHPLAARARLGPRDLDGVPMGVLLADHFSHVRTRAAFDAVGARFDIRMESQNYLPIFPFIEAGHCASIVDPLSAETYQMQGLSDVVFRPFDPVVMFQYAIYTPVHRPMSQLATEVSSAWKARVQAILTRRGVLL